LTSSARDAFRYPNFRYFMSARVLITSAAEMQAVAVGWQIYSLTHRPLDLGLVGLAQFSPGILLFLIAGHTADRFPRQRILQVCYGGFGLCSILLLALTPAWARCESGRFMRCCCSTESCEPSTDRPVKPSCRCWCPPSIFQMQSPGAPPFSKLPWFSDPRSEARFTDSPIVPFRFIVAPPLRAWAR
jgi:MFS family permease